MESKLGRIRTTGPGSNESYDMKQDNECYKCILTINFMELPLVKMAVSRKGTETVRPSGHSTRKRTWIFCKRMESNTIDRNKDDLQ